MNKKVSWVLIGLLGAALLSLAGCAAGPSVSAPTLDPPDVSAGRASWEKVVPGGDAVCSDGSEFAFYTRAGDPEKLLFYLQGGGACWNLQTCDPLGRPSYTVNLDAFHPSQMDGIFNFSRADNPLSDHTMVFVPYCSADVHLGDATQNYTRPVEWMKKLQRKGGLPKPVTPTFTVLHRGLANARAALKWLQNQPSQPRTVLVAGSSAGSIPSPYYAQQVAALYPEAQVSQLGDGSGGYRQLNSSATPYTAWNTIAALQAESAYAELAEDNFNFETLYVLAAAAQPRLRLHAYDTAEDDVQHQFLQLAGVEVDSLQEAIELNQADIRRSVPTFQSYIAAGELHTIFRRPEFYQVTVGTRSIRDWVADIVAGQRVGSVSYEASPRAKPEK